MRSATTRPPPSANTPAFGIRCPVARGLWKFSVTFACLGANHLQTNHADFGDMGRTSAARSPYGTAQNGSRRTRRHEPTGLITQRSLVQIQPAQRRHSPRNETVRVTQSGLSRFHGTVG
jgi:hypothetical protein